MHGFICCLVSVPLILLMENLLDLSPPPTPPPPPVLPPPPPPPLSGSTSSSLNDWYKDGCKSMASRSFRTTKDGGTSRKMKSAYGQYVLAIPRASNQITNFEKGGKRIPKEEAICRICFKEFKEENTIKVNCACPVTLIHEPCATVWSRERGYNKCDDCGQELKKTPVILLPTKDSAQHNERKKVKKLSCFSRFLSKR